MFDVTLFKCFSPFQWSVFSSFWLRVIQISSKHYRTYQPRRNNGSLLFSRWSCRERPQMSFFQLNGDVDCSRNMDDIDFNIAEFNFCTERRLQPVLLVSKHFHHIRFDKYLWLQYKHKSPWLGKFVRESKYNRLIAWSSRNDDKLMYFVYWTFLTQPLSDLFSISTLLYVLVF